MSQRFGTHVAICRAQDAVADHRANAQPQAPENSHRSSGMRVAPLVSMRTGGAST